MGWIEGLLGIQREVSDTCRDSGSEEKSEPIGDVILNGGVLLDPRL